MKSMNMSLVSTVALLSLVASKADLNKESPIQKVMQMLSDLETKILSEGTAAQKVYDEFAKFCEDRSTNLGFEVKTGKAEVKELDAAITKASADAQSLTAKIEEISASIAADEADLSAATEIRTKEKAAFEAEERELMDAIDTLQRAISIVENEMSKHSASMMQLKSATSIAEALKVIVQATSLNTEDASKLESFAQNSEESNDEDLEASAPAGSVFKSSSGGVASTLQDLFEKAESQLEKVRKSETKSVRAYDLLATTLKDAIKYGQTDLARAKKNLSASNQDKASAQGDLAVTSKDLAEDTSSLASLHQECMAGAEDFTAEAKSRGEELKALATAKKVIKEATSGAADQAYSLTQISFLQRSQLSSGADLANFEAIRLVRDLAKKHNSPALTQLAIRMSQAMHAGAKGGNPFAKVKALISNMIESLERQGDEDGTEHSFCEKELAETAAKKSDREAKFDRLSATVDAKTAKASKLREQVAELEKGMALLARSQAEATKIRAEEKAAFDVNSAEMAKGLQGVQAALKVLKEYYAQEGKSHESAEGAGNDIIGLLEVVETDFSKGVAELTANEQSAVSEYNGLSKANEIEKESKTKDIQYKTKESKSLGVETMDANNDRATVQQELSAVNEYNAGLKARCIAKAESYAERARRRDEEIAGLKEALSILEGEAMLLQAASKHKLRGVKA